MNENPISQSGLIETNDSLEAVSVFRTWKNVFFLILLVSLLLSQVGFWLVNLKIVEAPAVSEPAVGGPGAVITPAATTAPPSRSKRPPAWTPPPKRNISGTGGFFHSSCAIWLPNPDTTPGGGRCAATRRAA